MGSIIPAVIPPPWVSWHFRHATRTREQPHLIISLGLPVGQRKKIAEDFATSLSTATAIGRCKTSAGFRIPVARVLLTTIAVFLPPMIACDRVGGVHHPSISQ